MLAEVDSDDGIGALRPASTRRPSSGWSTDWPAAPAIMAGMVGSRQGWREAAYAACPATPESIAGGILRFATAKGRPVAIVPGVMVRSADRDGDVIRGEETQIARPPRPTRRISTASSSSPAPIRSGRRSRGGASPISRPTSPARCSACSPTSPSSATRSRRATDELSTLPGFALGIRRTVVDGLPFLAAIFSVRARQLLDARRRRKDNLAYLSGLVIGGEIAAARDTGRLWQGRTLRIIGSRSLARAYARAFDIAGYQAEALDGSDLVVAGLLRLARIADLLPAETQR